MRRTTQARVATGEEFLEKIGKQRLQWRRLLEQQPSGRQIHVIRVPCLRAIEKGVSGVESAA